MPDTPLLLTKAQAAALLGVSASTFANYVKAGSMPPQVPGLNRWSRTQIERAAAGEPWHQPAPPAAAADEYARWEASYDARRSSTTLPHSTANSDFNPDLPLGKREIRLLLALHGRNEPIKEGDVPGVSVATTEKLGLRGYLEPSGYFFKLLLTREGKAAAERIKRSV